MPGMKRIRSAQNSAALGDDLVGLEALELVAQVGANAAPRHLVEQVLHRLRAEAVAGFAGRVEEHEFEAVAPAFAPELLVDAEQKLEHRPAAHGRGFVRVASKADGNGAATHCEQALADALGGRDAFARRDGVFDARQLLDEAAARGDDQCVVAELDRRWSARCGHRRSGR